MRKIGLSMWILSLAATLTIFSTGFAAWFHSTYPNTLLTGSYEVYDVEDADAFIDRTSVEMFDYHSLHFTDGEGNAADSGVIRATYSIDLTNCYNAIIAAGKTWNGELTVALSLGYENALANDGLFAPLDDGHNARSVTSEIEGYTGSTVHVTGTSADVTHTFKNLAQDGTLAFTVVYTINCPQEYADGGVGNFRNNFGKYLKAFEETKDEEENTIPADKTQFTTTARITDIMG